MGKEQDLILAVRNQDLNLLHKILQKNAKSTSKLSMHDRTNPDF